MIFLHFFIFPKCFKKLFFRPPVPDIAFAIAKVNLDINQNCMMKSVTSLHQLSLRIFFCVFFAIKVGNSGTIYVLKK